MRQPYPSDMTDAQWELLADLFPEAKTGRPREVSIRDVVDAIFYVNRTGVQWRYLPHDSPRWDVVYSYFRKWGKDGTWDKVQRVLREGVRQTAGREAIPSLAGVDSQSVKGTECGGDHGIDGPKKRSTGSSVTSWWTPWACFWPWWSRRRRSPTPRRHAKSFNGRRRKGCRGWPRCWVTTCMGTKGCQSGLQTIRHFASKLPLRSGNSITPRLHGPLGTAL